VWRSPRELTRARTLDREFRPRQHARWRAAEWARWRSAIETLLGSGTR
jgi:glycerol kinase